MRIISTIAIGLTLMVSSMLASATPTTLTFSTTTSGTSYTEGGLTITSTSAEPVRTNGSRWFLDCCDVGPETFSLATGGLFDLLSVFRGHVDSSDPIVWTGWLGGSLVATTSYNSGQGSDFNFSGFNGLDLVTVSTSGSFTDPSFDNLSFQASQSQIPEPESFALFGLALAGLALTRCKAKQA